MTESSFYAITRHRCQNSFTISYVDEATGCRRKEYFSFGPLSPYPTEATALAAAEAFQRAHPKLPPAPRAPSEETRVKSSASQQARRLREGELIRQNSRPTELPPPSPPPPPVQQPVQPPLPGQPYGVRLVHHKDGTTTIERYSLNRL
jgi:hypothetical protein